MDIEALSGACVTMVGRPVTQLALDAPDVKDSSATHRCNNALHVALNTERPAAAGDQQGFVKTNKCQIAFAIGQLVNCK